MLLGRVKELEGRESEEREDELEREEREEMAERLVEVNLDLTEVDLAHTAGPRS